VRTHSLRTFNTAHALLVALRWQGTLSTLPSPVMHQVRPIGHLVARLIGSLSRRFRMASGRSASTLHCGCMFCTLAAVVSHSAGSRLTIRSSRPNFVASPACIRYASTQSPPLRWAA